MSRIKRLMAQFDSIHHEGWSKANPQKVYDHMEVHGYRDPTTLMDHITERSLENLGRMQGFTADKEWMIARDIEQRSGVPARAIGRALANVGIYSHRKLYQGRMQRIYYVEDIQHVLNNL